MIKEARLNHTILTLLKNKIFNSPDLAYGLLPLSGGSRFTLQHLPPLRPSLPVTRGPPVRGHAAERKKKEPLA